MSRTLFSVKESVESTEADLWARACRDDGVACGLLFDLHHTRVYNRALGLVAHTHDAEDIAAAAFFELWRKRRAVPAFDTSGYCARFRKQKPCRHRMP